MNTRITDKDIFTAIKTSVETSTPIEIDAEVLLTWATKKLDQLEHRKVKARERAQAKKAESDPLTDAILEVLTEEPMVLSDIAAAIVGEDITVSKVAYRLNKLAGADEPIVEKGEVTVKEEGQRARKLVAFRRIG